MATLIVSATQDYSADLLVDIDLIDFTNALASTATFASTQFDGLAILDDVTFDGSLLVADNLVVRGGSLDASHWQFANWDASGDTITLTGLSTVDLITGSRQKDTIRGNGGADNLDGGDGDDTISGGNQGDTITGGAGRDRLIGGDGNDKFRYTDADHLVDGEVISGGAGTADRLIINQVGPVVFDFRTSNLTGVEILEFRGTGGNAAFDADQSATLTSVIGSSDNDSFQVLGSAIDISGIGFSNWDTFFGDDVYLLGTAGDDVIVAADVICSLLGDNGADTMTGGSAADFFFPGLGLDSSFGNGGNDEFQFLLPDELEALETIDGGEGTDTIVVMETDIDGVYDLRDALPANVENLDIRGSALSDTTTIVTFTADYLGAAGITHVNAGADTELRVDGPDIDVSMVTFAATGAGTEIAVILEGDAGANTIIGSTLGDTIIGGLERDEMSGGSGADSFVYESLDDSLSGLTRDRINDFVQAEDIIEIRVALGFTFIEDNAFSATGAAEVNYELAGANTLVNLDGDGDGAAESRIVLTGQVNLINFNFILS